MIPPVVPRPPTRPDPLECCQRGCCPCIFDYYDGAMDRWRKRVEALGHDPDRVLAELNPPTAQA